MLQIKEISKQYKTESLVQQALDKVSLNLRDNEFVAILGPSGSGKTTLLNILSLLDSKYDGDIFFNGKSYKGLNDFQKSKYREKYISYCFQKNNLISFLNEGENRRLDSYLK